VPRYRALARGGRPLAGLAWHQCRPRRASGGRAPAPYRQDRAPRPAPELLLDPSPDLQDPRRSECHRFTFDPRARYVFRRRGRAVLHRIVRPGPEPDFAKRGLRSRRRLTRHRHPLRLGHLAATRRQDPRARLYPCGRQRRRDLFCSRPLPQPRHSRGPDRRPHGHDAAHLSRLVGKRRVYCVAAQRHCLGCGCLIAAGALRLPNP